MEVCASGEVLATAAKRIAASLTHVCKCESAQFAIAYSMHKTEVICNAFQLSRVELDEGGWKGLSK